MPHLQLFRRTWKFSEDDFVYSSIALLIIRALLFILAASYVFSDQKWIDESETTTEAILITTFVFCGLQILDLIALAIASGQGGVMEVHKRRTVWIWILIHFVLLLLELIFCCLSIWRIHDLYNEKNKVKKSAFDAVISWCAITLILIVLELINWVLHFDKRGRLKYDFYNTFLYSRYENKTDEEKKDLIRQMRDISFTRWHKIIEKRFTPDNTLDTNHEERTDAVVAVAGALTDFMTDLDITFSDLTVGLMLCRWQSLAWIGGQTPVPSEYVLRYTDPVLTDVAAPLDTTAMNPFDKLEKNWLHITRLKRYSHMVNGAYGWIFYYTENVCDCVAISRLCQKLSCSNAKAPDQQIDLENGINGPGGCLCAGRNCYLAAFMEMAQVKAEDILVFEIAEKFYHAAMMLVIDDASESIVVVVRGTLSKDDTLVDLFCAGETVPEAQEVIDISSEMSKDSPDRPVGCVAHAGMVRTARNIVNRILEEGWIEAARNKRPNYPLVICGHSLGAGLVSIMCVFLKPHYPEIKAYAFSPPAGLMNKEMAEFTRDRLVSVTYGYDVVGRASGQSMEDLRARIFHALCIYRRPKFAALGLQMGLKVLRNLFGCKKLPSVINLSEEVKQKLLDPDLEDAFQTPIGSKFKPFAEERTTGVSYVDRLEEKDRSMMRWEKATCTRLLALPRPYPRSLYPKNILEPGKEFTLDTIIESMLNPVSSGRLLHIFEMAEEFNIPGVESYKKRGYIPPPIAMWANAHTFSSILVHPKMLTDHMPIMVSTAIDRVYQSVMDPKRIYPKIHINTWTKEEKPLEGVERKLTDEDIEFGCHVRQLKSKKDTKTNRSEK